MCFVFTCHASLAFKLAISWHAWSFVPCHHTQTQACLEALARLLWRNRTGCAQAVELDVVPLAIQLLQQHPHNTQYGVGDAAARLLGVTAVHSTQTQTQAAHEGGIEVLLERLDGSCSASEGQLLSVRAAQKRVECLHAFCCIVQGNTFTKNAARQQGAPRLLSSVLAQHGGLLLQQGSQQQPQQQQQQQQQQQRQRQEALSLQVLTAAALALADLCQSNHANQVTWRAQHVSIEALFTKPQLAAVCSCSMP